VSGFGIETFVEILKQGGPVVLALAEAIGIVALWRENKEIRKKLEESQEARIKEITRVVDAVNSNTQTVEVLGGMVETLEKALETLERIINGRAR
jgi:hypothetical protein